MNSRLVVLATAAGCIVAAGVGSYVAVRSTPAGLAMPAEVAGSGPVNPPAAAALPPAGGPAKAARPGIPAASTAAANVSGARPDAGQAESVEVPATTPEPAESLTSSRPEEEVSAQNAAAQASGSTVEAAAAPVPVPSPVSEVAAESIEVPAEAVFGIRLDTSVSSERSRVEDPVTARITRDVAIEGRTAIPAGTEVVGYVSLVERGGRVRERARLGVKFTAIVLADHTRIPIDTPVIYREGVAKTGEATGKIGASAVIGGILGGIVGGKRGAAIGGAAGAAGGTAVVMAGDRSEAALAAGTTLTLRLAEPVLVPQTR